MNDYEKLGAFYLGQVFDSQRGEVSDIPLLYDSRDLVTHAVCVGMTGSGKTGLCISLLEEATIDGIPSIVIDPKGDLSNLLLTFPQLRAEDFLPWVDSDEATRQGLTPDALAAEQADAWRKGLASTHQDPARIQRFKDSADFVIYTPGSSVGIPVSIASSFAPPAASGDDAAELMAAQAAATASSLLGLLGIQADPLQSREHILLNTLLMGAWQAGQSLELKQLVGLIQNPGVTQIGVVDLDSFFPPKDRSALAMRVNNLLASPQFANWLTGVPLDVGHMLHTAAGKPRVNIFSIAHLSDEERMFFVSLLLNNVVAWMRTQAGTSSLRALIYMDEIYGYLPPVASPPSKAPLMMLLKQARAFGVGVVLATQNPVDLDYKALSNAGTWFVGRLQTARDKARLLDGLEGAAGQASTSFNREEMEKMLSQLGNRLFLMNNVHDEHAQFFQTRWALSYLRGPLSRAQIQSLMAPRRDEFLGSPPHGARPGQAPAIPSGSVPASMAVDTAASAFTQTAPVLDAKIPQYYLPVTTDCPDGKLVYHPLLLGLGRVYIADTKRNITATRDVAYLAEFQPAPITVDWQTAQQASQAKLQTAISMGSTLLGALFGRSAVSAGTIGKAATTFRGVGRSLKESQDIGRAQDTVGSVQAQLDDLEHQLQAEVDALDAKFNALGESLVQVSLRPKKTDITILQCALLWMPFWERPGGAMELGWTAR